MKTIASLLLFFITQQMFAGTVFCITNDLPVVLDAMFYSTNDSIHFSSAISLRAGEVGVLEGGDGDYQGVATQAGTFDQVNLAAFASLNNTNGGFISWCVSNTWGMADAPVRTYARHFTGGGLSQKTGSARDLPAVSDASVKAFARAVELGSDDARRIQAGVQYLKKHGEWVAVNDIRFLQSNYHPQKDLSFYRMPWSEYRPIWTKNGFVTTGGNSMTGILRRRIKQPFHTEIIVKRPSLGGPFVVAMCGSTQGAASPEKWTVAHSMLGGVQDSTTGAGVFETYWNSSPNLGVFDHTGVPTNWDKNIGGNSPLWATLDCNGYNGGGRTVMGWQITIMTTSNNVHWMWNNANPMACGLNGRAATYVSPITCTNRLDIWSTTNSDWSSAIGCPTCVGNPGNWSGNSIGQEYYLVMVLNTNVDQAMVNDLTAAILMWQPQDTVFTTMGSSMMNAADGGGGGNGSCSPCPFTNSIEYIRSLAYPDDLDVEFASPGSRVSTMTYGQHSIDSGILGGQTNFPTAFFDCALTAGKNVVITTDGARNDVFSGTAVPAAIGLWNRIYGNFWRLQSNYPGRWLRIKYMATTMLPSGIGGGGYNSNLWTYTVSMATNQYVWQGAGGYTFPIGVLSGSEVTKMTLSGAHLDNYTNGAYAFLQEEMLAAEGIGHFYNPGNPTQPWIFGANILPGGDNVSLVMQTNTGSAVSWFQK